MNRQSTQILEWHVESILRLHRAHNPIKRPEIVRWLRAEGVQAHERQVREAIKQLRRRGVLILSGSDGYYMAESLQEVDDFLTRELFARISDLRETADAMKRAAREQFGNAEQVRMF